MNVDELVNEIYFPSPANSQPAAAPNQSQTQNSTQPPSLQKISANHQPNQMPPSQLQPQRSTVLAAAPPAMPATKSKSISNYIPKFAQTTVKIKEFYAQHRLKVIIMLIVLVFIIIIYGSYKTNGGLYKKLSGITFLSKILPKKEPLALPPPTTANMNPTTPASALLPPPAALPPATPQPPPATPQSPPVADKQESEGSEESEDEANDQPQPSQQPKSAPVAKSPKKKATAPVSQPAPLPPPPSKKKKRAQATPLMPAKSLKQVAPKPEELPKPQFLTNKQILESETNKKKPSPGEDSDAYYE